MFYCTLKRQGIREADVRSQGYLPRQANSVGLMCGGFHHRGRRYITNACRDLKIVGLITIHVLSQNIPESLTKSRLFHGTIVFFVPKHKSNDDDENGQVTFANKTKRKRG